MNNPDAELTYSEQLEEALGNDTVIVEDENNPGQYTGNFSTGEMKVIVNDAEVTYVSWTSHDYEGVAACWTTSGGYEPIE